MLPKTKLKNLKRIRFVFLLFALIVCIGSAPNKKINKLFEKADTYYDESNFVQALKVYEKIIVRKGFDEKAFLQAARCNRNLEQYSASDEYYTQLFYKTSEVEPALFLEYGELLMKLGRQDEARSYFTSYNNLMENSDPRVLRNIESIEHYEKYFTDSAFVVIKKLSTSTLGDDLNPVIYGDKLYFESNSDNLKSAPLQKSIYSLNLDDITQMPEEVTGKFVSKSFMAGFTIAQETSEIVLSIQNKSDNNNFMLYRAFVEDNGSKISRADPLNLEAFEGNACFPAISNNGKILVFASDVKTGVGGWDLYIAYRNTYGYSEPEQIPGFVNTMGNERNPYLLNDSILIFTSDGQGGLGGFDLFYINLNQPSSLPKNLGYPLNSSFDDLGFVIDADGLNGFLVSNREEQNTFSDLYSFHLTKIRACGVVTNQNTGDNLKNVAVNITGKDSSQFVLADNGRFEIVGNPGDEFQLSVWKEGYAKEEFFVNIATAASIGLYDVELGRFPIEKLNQTFELPVVEEKTVIQEETEKIEATPEKEILPVEKSQTQEGKTVFRLQIAASRRPLTEEEIRTKYKGNAELIVFKEENWFKYAIGEYNSFYEANQARKHCGVKDAFIAAYQNEDKVELMKAIKQAYTSSEISGIKDLKNTTVLQRVIIYFPLDGFQPSASEVEKINEIIQSLISNSELKVEIDGHTDNRGSSVYNLGLATERAKTIQSMFISGGISEFRISIRSFGENKLKVECDNNCTAQIHRENRRAEIILYK